jgi:hypothetical protein
MAVRAAIGAGRGRRLRQLLTESLVLALSSGVAGVALGMVLLQLLVALAPADLPRLDEVRLDTTALAFALVLSAASSVVFGLAPALQVSRAGLASGLRVGGKGAPLGAPARRLTGALVVVEMALAGQVVAAEEAGGEVASRATLINAEARCRRPPARAASSSAASSVAAAQ